MDTGPSGIVCTQALNYVDLLLPLVNSLYSVLVCDISLHFKLIYWYGCEVSNIDRKSNYVNNENNRSKPPNPCPHLDSSFLIPIAQVLQWAFL